MLSPAPPPLLLLLPSPRWKTAAASAVSSARLRRTLPAVLAGSALGCVCGGSGGAVRGSSPLLRGGVDIDNDDGSMSCVQAGATSCTDGGRELIVERGAPLDEANAGPLRLLISGGLPSCCAEDCASEALLDARSAHCF